jgi:AMP-binding enzyme
VTEREREPLADGSAELERLPWEDEQRLLGVGVRVQRRVRVQLRHAGAVSEAVAALLRGCGDPAGDVVASRLAALRRRLWRAPGWLARLHAAGVSPDDLESVTDLSELPTLDRGEYARSWKDLVDLDGDPELHVATSSGTTGQALLVPRSGGDGLCMWAAVRFWAERLGVALPRRPRLVLLCALPGGLEYSVRAPLFHDGALHRISTLRPRPLERLRKARAAVLSSDPAGLHWLLAQPEPPRPRLVLSSAQHLAPSLRAEAAARLGAPVVNYFATTETGPVAWECPTEPGRFHVLHPDAWVESVDGELAVTRLRDSPLPLLRYRTGDRGDVVDGPCACGARGRSIVGFVGRRPFPFRTPGGREVDAWALSWLFKDIPLVRFELAQVGPETFALRLDPGVSLDPGLLAVRLRRALVRLGFPSPRLTVALSSMPLAAKPVPFVGLDARPGSA